MANNTTFSTYPANKYEALTMLYLQNQNLSSMTPEQIYDLYEKTYKAMRNHARQKTDDKSITVTY